MTEADVAWTVITGSTGSIGSEIAEQLASASRAMVLVNRSEAKSQAQRAKLLAQYPRLRVEAITADLMDTRRVADAIASINSLPGRVDALYNNSGVLTSERVLSVQGFESQFAVNTLAPYQLIRGLQQKMSGGPGDAPAMIVNLASSAARSVKVLDLANLANPAKVGGLMTTYAQTKLAVTTLAPALANELRRDNIVIRAIDPGATKSTMTTGGNSGMPRVLAWLAPLLFGAAHRQASKLVASADPAAHQERSGIYVANRKERKMPKLAADPAVQGELVALLDRLLAGG